MGTSSRIFVNPHYSPGSTSAAHRQAESSGNHDDPSSRHGDDDENDDASRTVVNESAAAASPSYRFHRDWLPHYARTRLYDLDLACLGAPRRFRGRAMLKAETDRYGLPAFKVLGAAWASYLALCRHLDLVPCSTRGEPSLDELRRQLATAPAGAVEMVAATDGNHGCAVAWFANLLGLSASIFTPSSVTDESRARIAAMGPRVGVTKLEMDYDAAVSHAASFAAADSSRRILIQDTAWEGYTTVPADIVQGYATILVESDEALAPARASHVIVPVGVGSLAQAVAAHYGAATATRIFTVEPDEAACLFHSFRVGENTPIQTGRTIMPGLNCGTVSSTAWPLLRDGVAAAITVPNSRVETGMASLEEQGIDAGPCGAAPLAALLELLEEEDRAAELGLLDDENVVVLLILTEGSGRR